MSFNIKDHLKERLTRISDGSIKPVHSVTSSPLKYLNKLKTIELSTLENKSSLKSKHAKQSFPSPKETKEPVLESKMMTNTFMLQYISEINAKDIGLGKEPISLKKM